MAEKASNPPSALWQRRHKTLRQHYGRELPAESIDGIEFATQPFISSDQKTEWKIFRRYTTNQPKEDTNEQLEKVTHKFNVRNYVSKLEYPC